MTNKLIVDGTVIPNEKRTRCEVYTRCVGYIRPISQFNDGKKEEVKDRKMFDKAVEGGESMACKTPGKKLKSNGKGKGLARGNGNGPIGRPSKRTQQNQR